MLSIEMSSFDGPPQAFVQVNKIKCTSMNMRNTQVMCCNNGVYLNCFLASLILGSLGVSLTSELYAYMQCLPHFFNLFDIFDATGDIIDRPGAYICNSTCFFRGYEWTASSTWTRCT